MVMVTADLVDKSASFKGSSIHLVPTMNEATSPVVGKIIIKKVAQMNDYMEG